ncbi:TPA: sensor histidine kinase [Candidatus Gastranaerophilales bacterium HUM_20]|nr:putative histidine kinase [Clostridium sp. CAG:729]DAB22595.1 MAG TPA: sensor histidine kinase [Candidatus Gastranaerophilales bacterium HUM_20]
MIKILFVSDRRDKINEFSTIFNKNTYEFSVMTDETLICDIISVDAPDIIIMDYTIPDLKKLNKKIKSVCENSVIIFITPDDGLDKDLIKFANAFLTDNMSSNLILSTININLRMKNSLEMLSNSNKDLADSLYRLNALYSTSSQFAGTLDKSKLIQYMIEGMDKALSFSLTCTLSFCTEAEPVLILNSLYEISDELLTAIKLRTVLNYNSVFEGKKPPYEVKAEKLKVIKLVKYPASRFTFTLFQFDNMFAPISLGDNFFGCIEIFKEAPFTSEDSTCFQTIAQQVSLPLKSATLYQELIETNAKLEKLERLKSEFISIVSHELRTPLTSIKNSLDILTSGRCGEVTQSAEKFLSMAMRNVQRLSGIINDLLDLSKIEAGKMDFNFVQTNINTVIDYVKSALSEVAKSKGLTLITDETENIPSVNADPQRLEQVLTNLVSNAIKFTPENKTIKISSKIVNTETMRINEYFKDSIKLAQGEYIQVCVEDEGIGIAESDMLHAFDKFAQIENSLSRKAGGTGLGLPIAKQLLEAHKGAIWCDSELLKGSRFYFVIPVVKVEQLV